jgi:excisionase family DNA binding protein
MALASSIELVPRSDQEAALAKSLGQDIAGFVNGDTTLGIIITRTSGERLEGTIPTFALRLLAKILSDMHQGKPVTLVPNHAELTTQQVAAMLHVSRPYVIKLLDQGAIPHRTVGRHRRVRYDDLKAYIDRQAEARKATLRELIAYDDELGISDVGIE